MCVHVFGSTSSPGCCNYALRKTAIDNEVRYGEETSKTLLHNFYVDDLLKLVETEESAVKLIRDIKAMCQAGGFNLTKFISNKKKVIQPVPEYDRRNGVKTADLDTSLPLEEALGVYWDTENNIFRFKIVLKDKRMTRRGMLLLISSIFDPLGFVAPYTLRGKRILRLLCQDEIGSDEIAPNDIIREWQLWCKTLHSLEHYKISRCYKPSGFGKVKQIWLQHFSDASQGGYGQVSYLRIVNNKDKIHCCFLMGKARVTPRKFMSIPRLELTATVLSEKCDKFIKKELQLECTHENLWTDGKVVLGYIQNNTKRFKFFVANRIHQIHKSCRVEQWRYQPSKLIQLTMLHVV